MYRKITVMVPTRERIGHLSRMLDSFAETVGDPSNAELVFRCDSDDLPSVQFLCNRGHKVLVGPRDKGYRSLPTFFNEMARVATGDLLMCCNDDALFKTPGWPKLLLGEAEKYPDGIFNFGVDVGLNSDFFPFSIVSRTLVEAMGLINDPRLLFSDVFLRDVAEHFGRAARVNSVHILHDWAGHEADQTRREANQHEFDVVFKDSSGTWTDYYRALHDAVVLETVARIKARSKGCLPRGAEPRAARPTMGEVDKPPRGWSKLLYGTGYCVTEMTQLLAVIYREGVCGGAALLAPRRDRHVTALWSTVYEKLFEFVPAVVSSMPDDKSPFFQGDLANSRFLYEMIKVLPDLKAVIFDEARYAHLIAAYFLLKKRIKSPGIVVFLNSSGPAAPAGAARFVHDLRSGYLDNCRHDVIALSPKLNGQGLCYEIIR